MGHTIEIPTTPSKDFPAIAPPGVPPIRYITHFDRLNPFFRKTTWDDYSNLRLLVGSVIYGCFSEGFGIYYTQHAHQTKTHFPGVVGMMKNLLHNEGLNAFRAAFPPFSVHSPVAKIIFFPLFEYIKSTIKIPSMEYDSIEEESIRTGVSAIASSYAVFHISRAGELHNILASKFHTLNKPNPLPFGMLSALPKHGSPYYNRNSSSLMFVTRFFFPNLFWWPTYTYAKNYQSTMEMDPDWGDFISIANSALIASAVTCVAIQPIFYLREHVGSKNIPLLLRWDKDTRAMLKENIQKSIQENGRFYQFKHVLSRFVAGAPIAVIGAFTYEILRLSFIHPKYWKDFSW